MCYQLPCVVKLSALLPKIGKVDNLLSTGMSYSKFDYLIRRNHIYLW